MRCATGASSVVFWDVVVIWNLANLVVLDVFLSESVVLWLLLDREFEVDEISFVSSRDETQHP